MESDLETAPVDEFEETLRKMREQVRNCQTCSGKGEVARLRRGWLGPSLRAVPCPSCAGSLLP